MPVITLDVPEKIAQQIAAMPEAERNEWAADVLENALSEDELYQAELIALMPLTEEEHATLRDTEDGV